MEFTKTNKTLSVLKNVNLFLKHARLVGIFKQTF